MEPWVRSPGRGKYVLDKTQSRYPRGLTHSFLGTHPSPADGDLPGNDGAHIKDP